MADKRKKRSEAYGDTNHPGYGIIPCAACGDPLRDHDIRRRCPELEGEKVTTPNTRRRRNGE